MDEPGRLTESRSEPPYRDGFQKGKCPRHPAATITALTAATCGVLTGFVGFRSADLGHI